MKSGGYRNQTPLSQKDRINADLKEILQRRWTKTQLAREALHYSNQNSRITMEIFLLESREGIDPLLVQRAENTKKISALDQQIREQIESEEERGLLDAVETARWPYIDSYKHALDLLIGEHKPAQARAEMVKVTLPLLNEYHNALNAFVQFQGDQMNQELEKEIAKHKRADGQLRIQAAALQSAANAIIITDRSGNIISVNPAFTEVTGYAPDEALGQNPRILSSHKHPQSFYEHLWQTILAGQVWRGEVTNRRKDGRLYTEEQTITPVRNDQGEITHFVAIKQDVTERKQLEQQFRQAQKMEAVGRLSGGIAHDFNNLLGVIIGYSEILEERLHQNDRLRKNAEEIKKAGQRAASLTRQLLAFSRQQVLEPRVLDLNTVVGETEKMLRRLIGEDIELTTALASELGRVKVDQGQIEQVIMNLAVNARDAMPQGGKLILETANVELDEAYASQHVPVVPGRYVLLAVTDTGVGMEKELQAHIFEPFFTTKGKDKGTGLGLSVVYGVVKQSGGYIWVYSEPGKGTTFKIYLPLVEEGIEQAVPSAGPAKSMQGSETILLVEDEESLRLLIRALLVGSGYTVLEAKSGTQALEIAREHKETIDLLLTDVVMPGMNGRVLAEQVSLLCPDIKVLFMSGYTDHAVAAQGALEEGTFLLQKPFTRDALTRKVREVLDADRLKSGGKLTGDQVPSSI